ncbi:hypothetical protein TorRG33x02_222920 [Trema orientale]|uniref:Reverse transcriptase zinc-binding domain-containing protein n=1 Tax=Trema orientale TaxID=63057 RepID=A0A2P5E8U7_TREOI|nr:hypothetical protein TorRG33x02_222920 [Trema orientale]
MKRGGDSLQYLGVPLFVGAPRQYWLIPWMDRILARFRCWMGMSLSMAGRLALAESVIYGSLIHSFQIYKWPSSLLSKLTSAIWNFIWSGSILHRKPVQVSWKLCCRPKVEGGLGLRDLSTLNKALLKKFAWRILTVDSDLFAYLCARFFMRNGNVLMRRKSSIWPGLRPLCIDLRKESCWLIGRHSKVKFWTENWMGSPLIDLVSSNLGLEPSLDSVVEISSLTQVGLYLQLFLLVFL